MPVTGFCILFIYDLGGFRGYGSGEICNLGFWFVTSTVWKPPWGGGALAQRICELGDTQRSLRDPFCGGPPLAGRLPDEWRQESGCGVTIFFLDSCLLGPLGS